MLRRETAKSFGPTSRAITTCKTNDLQALIMHLMMRAVSWRQIEADAVMVCRRGQRPD